MQEGPKFSIITICRNESENIRRTCESIIAQSFTDFEWIVVDGASTDDTLEILESFRGRIASLVSEPDDGIYDAMNKGIGLAKGHYLVFMNGGDSFANHNVLDEVHAAPEVDLIYGDTYFDQAGGERENYPDSITQGYLLKNMVPHQSTFYRRSLFDRFGRFDTTFRISADYDLNVRILEVGRVSHFHIPHPLAVFDRSGISSSPKFRTIRKQENHRIRKYYFPRYRWSFKFVRQEIRNRFWASSKNE